MAEPKNGETITNSSAQNFTKPKVGLIILGAVVSMATLFGAVYVAAKAWKLGSK